MKKNLENSLNENFPKKTVRNTEVIKSFGNDILSILKNIPGLYIAPTWVRKKGWEFEGKNIFFSVDTLLAGVGLMVHTIGYPIIKKSLDLDLSDYLNYSLIFLPFITNGISKGYEVFRDRKQKMEN